MALTSSNNTGFRYESLLYIPVLLGTIIGILGTLVSMRFYGKRIKKKSTSTALFLTSLAVFDMLSLVSNIPTIATSITFYYVDGWKESTENSVMVYISRVPRYWSNMVLLLAGIERVICVVLPHRVKSIFTRRVGIVCIILVIISGPVVLIPVLLASPLVVVPTNGTITHLQIRPQTIIDPDEYRSLILTVTVLYFGIPVIGVLVCNVCFVIMLYRYKSKHATNVRSTMTSSQIKELRTTKLVMIVTVIFIVCVSPVVILYLLIVSSDETVLFQVLLVIRPIFELLETLNYSMNVVVYYVGSSNFRTETREMMSQACRCCKPAKITPVVKFVNK